MKRCMAIETVYKGYRFRSRIEARWAVLFDHLSIPWDYEREGFDLGSLGWYLPDFWVPHHPSDPNGYGRWIEIKGGYPTAEEIAKCAALADLTGRQAYILWGSIGREGHYCLLAQGKIAHDLYIMLTSLWWDLRRENIPEALLTEAIKAARSARFEFGESGTGRIR